MFKRKRAGFYIGNGEVRAVEVAGNGRPAVIRTWRGDSGHVLSAPGALKEVISKAISGSDFGTRNISVSIPDTLVRIAVFDFEELPKSKKDTFEIVKARAAKELDLEPVESVFSFQVLPSAPLKKVLCVVAKRDMIEALEEGVCSSGRRNLRISPHSLNIVNLLSADGEDASIIIRASDYLAVLIFKSGVLDFYRCKAITGDDVEVKRELVSTFAFYCGRNPGHRVSRVLLFDETGTLGENIRDSVPATVELPGPASFLLNSSDVTGKDLSLLSAAGSCI